jgi:hypothetical protein
VQDVLNNVIYFSPGPRLINDFGSTNGREKGTRIGCWWESQGERGH